MILLLISSKMKCDSNPCIIMGTNKQESPYGRKVYPFYMGKD